MTDQAASIIQRLCRAESPDSFKDWEKKDGYYVATCRVSADDIPDLIDLARQWPVPAWPSDDLRLGIDVDDIELLPVTAWRTLADLKCSESVEPLIGMLHACDLDDDWMAMELPHVFGKIGKPAIEPLHQLANDPAQDNLTRSLAAESLQRVAEYHADTRDDVVARLSQMMAKAAENSVEFNTILLVGLAELGAVEAAEGIERAFADDRIDVGMMGDWETIRGMLGADGMGLAMPLYPHNSIRPYLTRTGIGIFSDRRIFEDGDSIQDAEEAYYQRAWDLFSKSTEAKKVVERHGELGWFRMLLQYGIGYCEEIVDELTTSSVEDFLLEFMPRKVSMESDEAACVIFELEMFWEYLNRAFALPAAPSIIEWLKAEGLVARLEAALSDPANFGMAKSLFAAGENAGYDMTSAADITEFIAAHNQLLQSEGQQSWPAERPYASAAATPISRGPRIGRNDPCPCGSGKKYKKCCR